MNTPHQLASVFAGHSQRDLGKRGARSGHSRLTEYPIGHGFPHLGGIQHPGMEVDFPEAVKGGFALVLESEIELQGPLQNARGGHVGEIALETHPHIGAGDAAGLQVGEGDRKLNHIAVMGHSAVRWFAHRRFLGAWSPWWHARETARHGGLHGFPFAGCEFQVEFMEDVQAEQLLARGIKFQFTFGGSGR